MKFSIITPTLNRESLARCCKSVDNQTLTDQWEHIIQVDSTDLDTDLMKRIEHPQRHIYCCGVHHNDYGNTCRRLAWEQAAGEWLLMLDDDNFLFSNRVLQQLEKALLNVEYWAIFPIWRLGSVFFNDPPGLCQTDTANILVRREIGRWPDIPDYTADGHWVEALKAKYPYSVFPDFRPIVMMEQISEGK
jgi:glycosyltransferase involved in cell wall biosynthesis